MDRNEATLVLRLNYELRSPETGCPHIVKTLLILMKTLNDHNCPLAYRVRCMTLKNTLDIV